MARQTDPAAVIAAMKRARTRNTVRQEVSQLSPAALQWNQELFGRSMGAALPRSPQQFLEGTFTPLTPIEPVAINWPADEMDRPEPRQRQMPPGWNMPVGEPGTEGLKLASFQTLRTYADIYSIARACIQTRKGEIRGKEWDIMPTEKAEKAMRGDVHAHRDFAERKNQVVKFFRKPDPDYLSFASYIDALMEEMLVTDAMSLYLHPTQKKGGYGPFGKDVAALEIISGSTIRPLVNSRGGRVRPPSPAYQQYLYGVPRVDLMQLLLGEDQEEIRELGKPAKQYRGDQLMYLPYTQRAWTPYGFPPLERTLIPTITGLRKQQYQLNYFDEGTIPGTYISPGEQLGWTPNQLQIWQDQQNALAGDPAYKHKSIALPPGSKVFPMRPVPLADQFDEVVMSQVCMGYDVMPMEMGISPKVSTTQSPGAANQMAKASEKTNERKSLKPTLSFFTDIFNVLIQVVWGQEDMRFVFEGLEEDEDENQLVDRLVQMLQYGLASIDECRIALNKPPWGLPITSDPVYVNPTAGMVPLGSIDPLTGKAIAAAPPAAIGAPPAPGGPGSPPSVGGAPKPVAAIPGGSAKGPVSPGSKTPDGTAAGGAKPSGPGQQPPVPGVGPDGKALPPVKPHPDDKVGQHQQAMAEGHAQVQHDVHDQFAAGKPMEPPVRPPITDATEDADHPDNQKPKKRADTKAMLSELDMLCRITCKGRDPSTWEARHLPAEVLSYYVTLTKSFNPNDAAAITHDFIVMCFGTPTLVAQLEEVDAGIKTFSTAVPLNSQGGQQGLVPYDLDGGSGGRCRNCGHTCPHRPGPTDCPECPNGHCTMIQFDNGGTVDTNRQGGLRQDQADMVVKAAGGGADPKDPLPLAGRITRAWPGWRYDLQLAAIYEKQIAHGLSGCLDASELARDWLTSNPPQVQKGALSALGQLAWGWLVARGYNQRIRQSVTRVLGNLWAEGFAVGRESGKEMLDSAYDSDFWNKWTPGDPDAARLAAGSGLQHLLQSYGIATIRSVTQTRMTQLANLLADGFDRGDSAETIADAIEPILRAPQRARMIAVTELARATTQAAIAEYKAAGQEGKKWSVTGNPPDGRVCPRCKKNGEQGTIPMDRPFESGDEFTPGHPECRCAILPDDLPDDTFTTPGVLGAIKAWGLTPQQLSVVTEDLSKGLTLPEILAYVAPHLVPSETSRKAGKRVPKDSVHYRDGSTAQHCGNCIMFRPLGPGVDRGTCTLVEGDIDQGATCDRWSAARAEKVGPHGYSHGWVKAGPDDLAAAEKSGIKDATDLSGGKQAETKLVTYNNGDQWVHKDFHQPAPVGMEMRDTRDLANSEEAASLVAQAVGARAPRAIRTGRNSIATPFVPNQGTYGNHDTDPSVLPKDRHIGLTDGLTANNDRHPGNLLKTPDGPVAIDHSETWRWADGKWEIGSSLARGLDQGDFSADELAAIGQRLQALRPDFERIFGGTQQHDGTMRAFNHIKGAIGPATKATKVSREMYQVFNENRGTGPAIAPTRTAGAVGYAPGEHAPESGSGKGDAFEAGGLAVRAADTGRVLMLQRAHNEEDPAGGYWEFPGGRLDPGESVEGAARREWAEEVGLPVPKGRVVSTWDAGNYRGHVMLVESEDAAPLLDREKGANPDDPDGEAPEAIAWWDPSELRDNPVVRPELQDHPKRVRRALEATGQKVGKGMLSDLASSVDAHWVDDHNRLSDRVNSMLRLPTGKIVYQQLLENYPPDSIAWVKRATWKGPYLVSWNLIDHDDMDSWAASHEPAHVKRFEEKIKAHDDDHSPASRVNPVVLVADPDGNFIDVDGHHRALAYHNLKRPILAWVGKIDPADREAMEQTHNDQVHEGASLKNKSFIPDLMKDWHDAWRHELRAPDGRWIRGGVHAPSPEPMPAPGGPVTFRVRYGSSVHETSSLENARAKQAELAESGIKSKLGYAPGHDARHVATLVERVRNNAISRGEALENLDHAPKLQEKLLRHLSPHTQPERTQTGEPLDPADIKEGDTVEFTTSRGDVYRIRAVQRGLYQIPMASNSVSSAGNVYLTVHGYRVRQKDGVSFGEAKLHTFRADQARIIEAKQEPEHEPEQTGDHLLVNFQAFYRDAQNKDQYLRMRSKRELVQVRNAIDNRERSPRLDQLRDAVAGELARREGKPQQAQRLPQGPKTSWVNDRVALETAYHSDAEWKATVKKLTPDDLSEIQSDISEEIYNPDTSNERRSQLRRLNYRITDEQNKRVRARVLKEHRDAKKAAQAEQAMAGWRGLEAEFGVRLISDGTPTARAHIAQFETYVPVAFKKRLAKFGTVLAATKKTIGGHEPDLANVQPRGYAAGMTWNDSAGVYRPMQRKLVMGNTVGHGSSAMPLHEGSHAIDHALRYPSDQPAFYGILARMAKEHSKQMNPYYTPDGNPDGFKSEAFAELLGTWMLNKKDEPKDRQLKMARTAGIYGAGTSVKGYMAEFDAYFAKILALAEAGKDPQGFAI